MICILDHQDSFTYNIFAAFRKLGASAEVLSTSITTISQLRDRAAEIEAFVLSPGPGHPDEAHLFYEILSEYAGHKPVLGICLGHQAIVQHFGGKIIGAKKILHGKSVPVFHDQSSLFRNMPSSFLAMRYNSLEAHRELPGCLRLSAWNEYSGETSVMGVRHVDWPLYGVQFHPESVGTPQGFLLLKNFLFEVQNFSR